MECAAAGYIRFSSLLAEDLNVLLEEFGVKVFAEELKELEGKVLACTRVCESKYGRTNMEYDAKIIF